MNCPHCDATQVCKNGHRRGKQNYLCRQCGRQFLESRQPPGYSDDVKQLCIKMYVNGMGFRAIERVTGISHNSVINWVKELGQQLPDAPAPEVIPEVGELDELQTFVGSKKTKFGSGQQ